MNLKIREICIELVYKIISSESGIELIDEDFNYYLNSSKELLELFTIFDKVIIIKLIIFVDYVL